MAECCSDPNVLFKDDNETAGTFASKGYTLISSVATSPVAAKGINGSFGIEMNNGSGLGQLSTPTVVFPTKCTDILAFGFGGYWTFPALLPGTGGFYFAELRKGTGTILSFYRDFADLIVFIGVSSDILVQVNGLFTDNVNFIPIDIAGTINSDNNGIGSSDGNLIVDVLGVERVCLFNTPRMNEGTGLSPGWDNIALGVHGEQDCIYVTNGWICGQGTASDGVNPGTNDPFGNPCCGQGGPGGSSTTTTFHPFTPSINGNTSPIIIAPGGAAPSFTACTGNGLGPVLTDPTDPQTMTGIDSPLMFLDLTLPDATVLRLAQESLSTPAAKFRDGRIISIGRIAQTLSDHYGRMSASLLRVTFSDTDGVFRAFVDTAATKFLKNSPAVAYLEADAARRVGTAPLKVGAFLLKNWKPLDEFRFEIELVDELSAKQGPTSLDRPIPDVNIADLFPTAPENILSIPLPYYYGQYGDDEKWTENPKRTPVGIVPVIGPCREETLSDGLVWRLYLICRWASKEISSVFASNLAEGVSPGPIRMDLSEVEGTDFLIPGKTNWIAIVGAANYLDVLGIDGETYRITAFYARGPRADSHDTGGPPFSVNLCGIEDVGDGTGDVIDQAAEVGFHFWNYIGLQRLPSPGGQSPEAWPDPPIDSTSTPKVNRASVVTLNTLHLDRVPTTGYEVAWAIRERRSIRSYWEEFQIGTNIRLGRSRHQITFDDLDDAASVSGLTGFDHSNIIEGSFVLDPQSDEIVNKLTYVSGPEASTGRFSNALRSMTDGGSVSDYGETYEQPDIEIHPIRNPGVADDVISRKLLRLRTEPIYGRFDTDLQGIDLALGQLIEITHDLALGVAGWVDHVVKVTGIILDPTSKGKGLIASVLFESVNQTLVVQSIAGNGFTPVGLEGSSPSTAGVVGLESTGTAKRVGSG